MLRKQSSTTSHLAVSPLARPRQGAVFRFLANPGRFLGLALAFATTMLYAAESPEQTIEQVYGPQLTKVRGTPETADDLALAQDLVKDAKTMASDPALVTALLRRAVDLALADPEGAPVAQEIVGMLLQGKGLSEKEAWQELVRKGQDALRRRNLGADDKMRVPWVQWQLQSTRAALDACDSTAADRQLAEILRDIQGQKLKYQADEVRQLAARVRMEAPFLALAAKARKTVDPADPAAEPNADPKLNLAAGETLLAQTGNWQQALPYLVRSGDTRWNLILNMLQQAGVPRGSSADRILPSLPPPLFAIASPAAVAIPPLPAAPAGAANPSPVQTPPPAATPAPASAPASASTSRRLPAMPLGMTQADLDKMPQRQFDALKAALEKEGVGGVRDPGPKPAAEPPPPAAPPPSVKAADLIDAAQYLTALAAPARRPAPAGKVALLRQAADLLALAQNADGATLSSNQKLTLITQRRAAQDAADQSVVDLLAAFDRSSQLNWISLGKAPLKDTWTSTQNHDKWKVLNGGVIETSAGSWESMLHTCNTSFSDFVLEGELKSESDKEHTIFWLRDHNGAPYWQAEFCSTMTFLNFRRIPTDANTLVDKKWVDMPVKAWSSFRVVLEGDHCMIWVNQAKIIDASPGGPADPGGIGLVCLHGTTQYRGLRIRELK